MIYSYLLTKAQYEQVKGCEGVAFGNNSIRTDREYGREPNKWVAQSPKELGVGTKISEDEMFDYIRQWQQEILNSFGVNE